MAVEITWINHATFRLAGARVVYIDPWKVPGQPRDGDVVFVSHAHFDHLSAPDVKKVLGPAGIVVAPADVLAQTGAKGTALKPGQTVEHNGVKLTGVPAYNVGKNFHPKANGWLGAVIELDGVRVYYAGDTDQVPEMANLAGIDVALLPVGGTYTMNADEAARAAGGIKPKVAIPYHFGDVVGSPDDAKRFQQKCPCKVHLLAPGQSVTIGQEAAVKRT